MEKGRTIRDSTRSFLGLIVVFLMIFCELDAKEIFDFSSHNFSENFDASEITTVSFYFSGASSIDVDSIMKSIAKEKAEVVITGKTSLEGKALSPNLFAFVVIKRNVDEKSWLVTIDTFVNGMATKALDKDGFPHRGKILVSENILVFVETADSKEIEGAIARHLQNVTNKISCKVKPTFFVVH